MAIRRGGWILTLVLAALIGAFVVGPAALLSGRYGEYHDPATLRNRLVSSLSEFLRGRTATKPSSLTELVDYWFEWHAIKVAICLPLVIVSVLLVAALWRRHVLLATGAMVFAALALGVLILNIQATFVPLVALLPLASADVELDRANSVPLSVLVDEVARYYWVLALLCGVWMLACVAMSVFSWRRRNARSGADAVRERKMHTAVTVVAGLTALALLIVCSVSTYSALTPSDALAGLLGIAR